MSFLKSNTPVLKPDIINFIYNLHFEFGKVLINYVLSLHFVLMSFIIYRFRIKYIELLIHINQVIYIFVLKLLNPYYQGKNQLNHNRHTRKKINMQVYNIEHNRQIPIGI
jgi:hypothetical protein